MQAAIQEISPIVGLDRVQRGYHVREIIRLHGRRSAGASFEGAAEIVQRPSALAELPDGDIGIQPDQRALGVVVHGSAIIRVIAAAS